MVDGIIHSLLFPHVKLNIDRLHRKLQGKTVVITGASYGIGEALASLLAMKGVHLVLIARTKERLEAIKQVLTEKGAEVDIYALDLRLEENRRHLIEELRRYPEGVDYLINNAGKSICRTLEDSVDRFHDYTQTMALNYFAPVELCLDLYESLKRNRGHIISISAVNVLLLPAPRWTAYQASKSAFDQWLRAASPELYVDGVNTTSVYLPLVRTRMIEPTEIYKKAPALSPEHAARIIAKSVLSCRSYYKPWWLKFGELGSLLIRPVWKRIAIFLFLRK